MKYRDNRGRNVELGECQNKLTDDIYIYDVFSLVSKFEKLLKS